MSYIILGCSAANENKESLLSILKSRILKEDGRGTGLCEECHVFEVPESLKFGSFDALIALLDEFQKQDSMCESISRRIERQLLDLDPHAEFKVFPQRRTLSLDQYVRKFKWDDAKFPRTRPIRDNLHLLVTSVNKLDEEVRNKTAQASELRQQYSNVAKTKEALTYPVRDLIDVLTPRVVSKDEFVETEHLTSLVVVVPRGMVDEFKQAYENWDVGHVVPRSAQLFHVEPDKEGNSLWRIVCFRKAVEAIRLAARSMRMPVREFKYSEESYNDVLKQRESVEQDLKKAETLLKHVCYAAFSDTIVAWLHLKAMRVFVEAVLRYGVPPNFCSFVIKPFKSKESRLRAELLDVFSSSGLFGHSYIGDEGSAATKGPSGADMDDGEYYPYVSLNFVPLADKKI